MNKEPIIDGAVWTQALRKARKHRADRSEQMKILILEKMKTLKPAYREGL